MPPTATHQGRTVRLGRRHVSPPVVGPRRLLARQHLESLPPPAPTRDWIAAATAQAPGGDLGMMLNDQLGDCTCAALGHAVQIWTANTGAMVTPSDSAILKAYETVDGYVPGDPSTDQGGVETEVLGAWQRGLGGLNKLDGWIPVNPQNLDHVRKAIERYGIVYAGVALPKTIDSQDVWTVDLGGGPNAEAGSLGGHAIVIGAYDESSFTCCTWGRAQRMSVDWFLSYVDELYAPLCGALWCGAGTSPMGDTVPALTVDLQAVT